MLLTAENLLLSISLSEPQESKHIEKISFAKDCGKKCAVVGNFPVCTYFSTEDTTKTQKVTPNKYAEKSLSTSMVKTKFLVKTYFHTENSTKTRIK